jgi:hypothetical protein
MDTLYLYIWIPVVRIEQLAKVMAVHPTSWISLKQWIVWVFTPDSSIERFWKNHNVDYSQHYHKLIKLCPISHSTKGWKCLRLSRRGRERTFQEKRQCPKSRRSAIEVDWLFQWQCENEQ